MKISKITLCVLGLLLVLATAVVAEDAPPLTFKFSKASVPGAKYDQRRRNQQSWNVGWLLHGQRGRWAWLHS